MVFLGHLGQHRYSIAPPGGPIAWRDYVDFSSWRREEDGSLLQGATSCCSEEVPVFDGAIRGTMLIFGFLGQKKRNSQQLTRIKEAIVSFTNWGFDSLKSNTRYLSERLVVGCGFCTFGDPLNLQLVRIVQSRTHNSTV